MLLRHGWTGGQYSLYRVALGVYFAVHFAALVPWGGEVFSDRGVLADGSPLLAPPNALAVVDSPAGVTVLLVLGALSGLALAAGVRDREAAVGLWYLNACLIGRNPLILNPALPYLGWLLLAHALTPRAPWGSWAARGRPDPGGGWRLPAALFTAAWVLMAVGYTYSGLTKLESLSWIDGSALARILDNPLARPDGVAALLRALPADLLRIATWSALALELLFAPLALSRRLRPWLWAAGLAMHLSLIAVIDFADLSLGMVLLHAFTFDPAWVPSRPLSGATVFYDGNCGICHGFVRLALAEGARGLRFAPLRGSTFEDAFSPAQRAGLPDSLVLVTAEGRVLVRSDAALAVLASLGGLWSGLAAAGRPVPRALRDRVYDGVARLRGRLVPAPAEACPVPAPGMRRFFAG